MNVAPPQIRGAPSSSSISSAMGNANVPSTRIGDMLDQVKAEYEAAIQQLNLAKIEQMELERKIQSQIVEMDQIQQTLKTLETNHRRLRQQYEEDIMRMRRQLEGASVVPSRSNAPQRSNSPSRAVSVQAASRSLQVLGQQTPQNQQSSLLGTPQTQGPNSSMDGSTGTPTGNRRSSIPPLNREAVEALPKAETRTSSNNLPLPNSTSDPSSPVLKKAKMGANIPSLSNGKSTILSNSTTSNSNSLITSVPKIHRDHPITEESSPPANTTSSTAVQDISNVKQATPKNHTSSATSSSTSSASNTIQKSSNSKASKLNWSCVYSSKSSVSYQENERPAAEMHQSMDHQSVVCCVRFSTDGTMMASGCHKTAQVFDVKTGDRKFSVSRPGPSNGNAGGNTQSSGNDAEDAYVRAVCFSPDCTKLVAGMPHNTIRIWDIATNEEGPPLTGHESEIYSLDYVSDLIVSGSGDRKIRLWDARTSQCTKIFGSESGGPSDGVTSVALSPDGRLLAAASLDKVVRIWDTETSQLLDRLEGHSDSVYSIAFSPDGKNVISGSLDRNIMLWDVCAQGRTTTRPRMLFQGHKDFVLSVAYTPDGRWLMSGSKDRSVVFWDPRSSRSVLTLTGYRNSVISVASSPTSPYFATGSGDCFAVVWKYQLQNF
ncbi:unnamed protein product [Albugo candida]|nr:unnamed protein product [Albugo candida]|eukprot:CCI46651.1 unnamed protein product [Albugo candida]